MPGGGHFRVAIKDSALRENQAVQQLHEREGEVVTFESRTEAEDTASDLTEAGDGRVVVQRAAPNDPSAADAYLVFSPVHRKRTPDGDLELGWTFDTTANQYGAIGEALITAPGTPAVKHFVLQDLAPYPSEAIKEEVRIDVLTDPGNFDWGTIRSAVSGDWANWTPDCEIRIRYSSFPVAIHQYFCEIKAGAASFQRRQIETMEAVAEVADVLKIRVQIDNLPAEYTVKFRRVGDGEPTIDWNRVRDWMKTGHPDQTGLQEFIKEGSEP